MTLLGDNLFQSTLLQEERHVPSKRKEEKKIFQSTLLQEERHDSSLFDNLSFEFQSTLLQEERLSIADDILNGVIISIHAPTRGATAKMHNYPYTYL